MPRSPLRRATLVGALAVTALIVGCTPTDAPSDPPPTAAPGPTSAASEAATPEPSETVAPIPGCDELVTAETAQTVLGTTAEVSTTLPTIDELTADTTAADFFASATESEVCGWIVPNSDGGFHAIVARSSADDVDALLDALRADPALTESEFAGATIFAAETEDALGVMTITYAISGTLWSTVSGTITLDGGLFIATETLDAVG